MHANSSSGRLGRYVIHGEVGKGGTGTVYRATDPDLDRPVAIKVLSPDLAGDPVWLRRFKREARTASRVNHPNIVSLYSVEEVDGRHFITMEYLQGATLRSVMPTEGYGLEDFLRIAVPITRALEAAHSAGITHRDLKPSNLFVTYEGTVKLLDFGIASKEVEPEEFQTTVTQTATFAGTAPYMAPEQIEGEVADPKSDLFSLGILFFEMLVGSRPFAGKTIGTVCAAILNDPPSDSLRLKHDLPKPLVSLVYACLERAPERRPLNTQRVLELLEALRDENTSTRAISSRTFARRPLIPKPKMSWVAAAVALLSLVTLALVVYWARPQAQIEGRPQEANSVSLPRSEFPLLVALAELADRSGSRSTAALTASLAGRLGVEDGLELRQDSQVLGLDAPMEDVVRLSKRLGADFLVLGEIEPAEGDRFWIRTELLDASTEERVLLAPVESSLDDLFSISRTLANEVLTAIREQAQQTSNEHIARNATRSADAYRNYQQASSWLHTEAIGSERLGHLESALDLYQRAQGLDPTFTDAWAQAALVALDIYRLGGGPGRLVDAERLSQRAYSLDADSPLANLSRGNTLRVQGKPRLALPFFDRYVELAPAHAGSYAARASCRWQLKRWQGAVDDVLEAVRLAPHAHDEAAARYLFHMRRYEEAGDYLTQALRDSPGDPEFVALMAEVILHSNGSPLQAQEALVKIPGPLPEPLRFQTVFYYYLDRNAGLGLEMLDSIGGEAWALDLHYFPKSLLRGLLIEQRESAASARPHFGQAVAELEAEVERSGADLRTLPVLAYAHACAGNVEAGRVAAAAALELFGNAVDQNNAGYQGRQIAVALTRLGDDEGAAALLRRLMKRPAPLSRTVLRLDPSWDELRKHEGFGQLFEDAAR